MRTPNTKCAVCGKPLYRRPSDMVRYSASCCKACRSAYFKAKPVSQNLQLGRQKGTNHLQGIPKTELHKVNVRNAMLRWSKNNPDKVKERGAVHRGANHHLWNGGINIFNQRVRRLQELRNWQEAVKKRDGSCCVMCGDASNLESHHIKPLSTLLAENKVNSIEQARACSELWNIENGTTLCQRCHYKLHGRKHVERERNAIQQNAA